MPEPVPTITRHIKNIEPMKFSLNAATKVTFHGDCHIHAITTHEFSGDFGGSSDLFLSARARQFSCFILMVGRIASATLFEPKAAILIQNKDDLKIPLILKQIPTPKQFRDAIESLSPQQQRFAKAYRAMQLESTLMGIVVIQVKPQIEKLLRLPVDALTKEIQMTEDVLMLYIKHQIPSDQLRFDGNPSASNDAKVAAVKSQVKALLAMIEASKAIELEDKAKETFYNALDFRAYKSDQSYEELEDCEVLDGMECSMAVCPINECEEQAIFDDYSVIPRSRASPDKEYINDSTTFKYTEKADDASGIEQKSQSSDISEGNNVDGAFLDVTKLPKLLDASMLALDKDNSLRPAIISLADVWSRNGCRELLGKPTESELYGDDQEDERNKAFDLLDAITRSGTIDIDDATLHVVVATTHCFDKTLIDTVVQGNVNPIDSVERSTLIMASVIHNNNANALVEPTQLSRLQNTLPSLFSAIQEKE